MSSEHARGIRELDGRARHPLLRPLLRALPGRPAVDHGLGRGPVPRVLVPPAGGGRVALDRRRRVTPPTWTRWASTCRTCRAPITGGAGLLAGAAVECLPCAWVQA